MKYITYKGSGSHYLVVVTKPNTEPPEVMATFIVGRDELAIPDYLFDLLKTQNQFEDGKLSEVSHERISGRSSLVR